MNMSQVEGWDQAAGIRRMVGFVAAMSFCTVLVVIVYQH